MFPKWEIFNMKKIKEIFNDIINSLKTNKDGYSARKLSGLIVMILVVVTHVKWYRSDKWEYLGEVLAFDFTFILACLGLTTWQSVKENTKEKVDS
jgi:hypothetical protein